VFSKTIIKEMSSLQMCQIERGFGMFIHFGVNTFNEIEWFKGNLPATTDNSNNLYCDQWIKTAKEAEFSYIIFH
jgi:alpha-L-fucosidase